ncbi:hypothetical protein F5B20DRAFT_597194 [Whalleya microplaca]|nr:hypothetical protein F5B20DRAFT_597194 [Whalleya microplaca]
MSSPVSIGDVVLMIKVAWKLARAFTKGRKSAPAEFCEIENQLYSMSAALEAIKDTLEKGETGTGVTSLSSNGRPAADSDSNSQSTVDHILHNCRQTLTHLESIVEKYSVIIEPTDSSKRRLGRWNQYIIKNWRKIEWTTEKGDLSALRSQIMIHTNSLNLLLGVSINSQASNIRQAVEKTGGLVEELFKWYTDNLKDVTAISRSSNSSDMVGKLSAWDGTDIHGFFELAIATPQGRRILCPHARLNPRWHQSFPNDQWEDLGAGVEPIFACGCLGSDIPESHQATVQKYGLSHLIFPYRLEGNERSWVLYKSVDRATNQLLSLYITHINSSYINFLEETFLQVLSMSRADAIFTQGSGNSLCYIPPDSEEERVLASIVDLRIAQKSVESVTFKSIQILQYQTLSLSSAAIAFRKDPFQPMGYAEVLIKYNEQDSNQQDDVISTTLHLQHNTSLELDEINSIMLLHSIETVGSFKDGSTKNFENVAVAIQLISREAARELHRKLEDMPMELFIANLQYPRRGEKVEFHLQAARVECEDLYITNADITVVLNSQGKYRLIIVSRNKCTIVSQVLVHDFFTSPSERPNYTGQTYVVLVDENGTRKVFNYKHGFQQLSLSGAKGQLIAAS